MNKGARPMLIDNRPYRRGSYEERAKGGTYLWIFFMVVFALIFLGAYLYYGYFDADISYHISGKVVAGQDSLGFTPEEIEEVLSEENPVIPVAVPASSPIVDFDENGNPIIVDSGSNEANNDLEDCRISSFGIRGLGSREAKQGEEISLEVKTIGSCFGDVVALEFYERDLGYFDSSFYKKVEAGINNEVAEFNILLSKSLTDKQFNILELGKIELVFRATVISKDGTPLGEPTNSGILNVVKSDYVSESSVESNEDFGGLGGFPTGPTGGGGSTSTDSCVWALTVGVGKNNATLAQAITFMNGHPGYSGGRILVYPGTYIGPFTINTDMEIIGFKDSSGNRPTLYGNYNTDYYTLRVNDGNSVVIKNLNLYSSGEGSHVIEVTGGSENVLLENLVINSGSYITGDLGISTQLLNNPSVVNLTIKGSSVSTSASGIFINDRISSLTLENNYFTGSSEDNYVIYSSARNSNIKYNHFDGASLGEIINFPYAGNVTLVGNVFLGFNTAGSILAIVYGGNPAIYLNPVKYLGISSNTFIDNSASSVASVIDTLTTPSNGFVFVNNIIKTPSNNVVSSTPSINLSNSVGILPSNWFNPTIYSLTSNANSGTGAPIDAGYDFDVDPSNIKNLKPDYQYVYPAKYEQRTMSGSGYDRGAFEYNGGGGCISETEVCDGLDNDCDSQIDEEGVCLPCAPPVCGNNICESGETSITCPADCSLASAPSNFVASVVGGGVNLNWESLVSLQIYELETNTSSSSHGSWQRIYVGNDRFYRHTEVSLGEENYYRVSVINPSLVRLSSYASTSVFVPSAVSCSSYTTSTACSANTGVCRWCEACSGNNYNSINGNQCVPIASTCGSFSCTPAQCGVIICSPPPVLSKISPIMAFNDVETNITVYGSAFSNSKANVGGAIYNHLTNMISNSTQFTITIPLGLSVANLPLKVINEDNQESSSTILQIIAIPVLDRIYPNAIANNRDENFTIFGSGFEGVISVDIANIPVYIVPGTNASDLNPLNPIKWIRENDSQIKVMVRGVGAILNLYGTFPVAITKTNGPERRYTSQANLILQNWIDSDGDGVPDFRDMCNVNIAPFPNQLLNINNGCYYYSYSRFSPTLSANLGNVINFSNFSLSLGIDNKGLIEFLEGVSIMRDTNSVHYLEDGIDINKLNATVNSSRFSKLNVPTRLTFFNTSLSSPLIYRDGSYCSSCVVEQYNSTSTKIVVRVDGFSTYDVRQGTCGDGICSSSEGCSSCSRDCGTCSIGGGNNGGGGGGGGGGGPTVNRTINLDSSTTGSVVVSVGENLVLRLESQNYILKLKSVFRNVSTFSFLDTNYGFNFNQEKDISLNSRPGEEVTLKVTPATSGKINVLAIKIKPKSINDNPLPPSGDGGDDLPPILYKDKGIWGWVIIGVLSVLVIVLIIVILVFLKRRKARRESLIRPLMITDLPVIRPSDSSTATRENYIMNASPVRQVSSTSSNVGLMGRVFRPRRISEEVGASEESESSSHFE